jgi:hypothetical protein
VHISIAQGSDNSQAVRGGSPREEPGLLPGFLAGLLKPEDFELDGLSHDSGGADILWLRDFFFTRPMFDDLARRWSGTGSLKNSGRERRASESASFCWDSVIESRRNSGSVICASRSLTLEGCRTASCECSRPASEWFASWSTNASRCGWK